MHEPTDSDQSDQEETTQDFDKIAKKKLKKICRELEALKREVENVRSQASRSATIAGPMPTQQITLNQQPAPVPYQPWYGYGMQQLAPVPYQPWYGYGMQQLAPVPYQPWYGYGMQQPAPVLFTSTSVHQRYVSDGGSITESSFVTNGQTYVTSTRTTTFGHIPPR